MTVGTHPHLLIGNPISVPCLARLGARRSEIWRQQSADQPLSRSLRTEGFEIIICTPTSKSPARLVRYFFSKLDTSCLLSSLRAGHVSEGSFCGDEGTDGSELAEGVGGGSGQGGSSAWVGRSQTTDEPYGTRVSHGDEVRDYAGRWSVVAKGATSYCSKGPPDHPPPEKLGTEDFRINTSVPTIFCGAATRSMCSSNPSPSRYLVTDRLPHVVCLVLSQ
jgi:hypothetical protein